MAAPLAAAPAAGAGESRIWRSFRRSPLAWLGALIIVGLVAAAALAPIISPHDPTQQNLVVRLRPPAGMAGSQPGYYLGTDRLGRDVLSGILHGLRVSLLVALAGVGIGAGVGVPLGLLAGYFRGWTDVAISRLIELQLAIPTILLAMGVMAAWGRGLGKLLLVIGLAGWAQYARTARAGALSTREKDFVEAARASGAPDGMILRRHLFPDVLPPLVVLVAVEIPRVVLLEATLSFLGLGVPAEVPSLGVMIAEGYQVLFSGRWWVSVLPGAALMLLVFAVNMLGDWLRDALDPRLRGR